MGETVLPTVTVTVNALGPKKSAKGSHLNVSQAPGLLVDFGEGLFRCDIPLFGALLTDETLHSKLMTAACKGRPSYPGSTLNYSHNSKRGDTNDSKTRLSDGLPLKSILMQK